MNMFGPSLKSIMDTALDVDAWLDNECVKGYTDFDGAWIDLPPTEEEQFAMQRRDQLIELMHLNKPISPAWAIEMYFGCCLDPHGPAESLNDWQY